MITALDVAKRIRSLPMLSPAVTRLTPLLDDENATVADYEQVIRLDPGLTVNLLRLANSAAFGARREVETVRQAVILLGDQRVYELAVSAGLSQVVPDTLPGYGIDAIGYWKHCTAVAVLAETLAAELGEGTPDLTFTAGLLHDLGKLALGVFLEEQIDSVRHLLAGGAAALNHAEVEVLGVDHAQVGARVARHWKLPERVVDVCRWHHAPNEAEDGVDRRLVDLVHVADGLAHAFGFGNDVAGLSRRMVPEASQRLGIGVRRLEMVACLALEPIAQLHELQAPESGGTP